MATADPTGRPPAKTSCTYWKGNQCTATDFFDEEDITCYNNGSCDGFGTCRGCSKYDQGGLKFAFKDQAHGETQLPMNLKMYNIRAKQKQCCHWEGEPQEFSMGYRKAGSPLTIAFFNNLDQNGEIKIAVNGSIPDEFPESFGRGSLIKEGVDSQGNTYDTFNFYYGTRTGSEFSSVTISNYDNKSKLDTTYVLYLAGIKSIPVMVPIGATPNITLHERATKCGLTQAAPWQEGFTDDNPYALGCNGAKPECPFYTGPQYAEVNDAKMDTGDRITAKQVMELRFYAKDWQSFPNPVEVWEDSFADPHIWSWVRLLSDETEEEAGLSKWSGKVDSATGLPLIQKVEIANLRKKSPTYIVGSAQIPHQGTPWVGGPPNFPTLIKELEDLASEGRVLFPSGTSLQNPFVKKAFTHDDRFFYIAALLNTDREVLAINLSKHSQGTLPDEIFIDQVKLNSPDDIYSPFETTLPGSTFNVELVAGGHTRNTNHIRIFIDTGEGELDSSEDLAVGALLESEDNVKPSLPTGNKKYLKLDVYVEFIFYHSHVAQDFFNDTFGHSMVDPWINHLTKFQAAGNVLNLTGNSKLNSVYWNTISSEGKKTLYSIEEHVVTSSSDISEISWEPIDCNHVLVTFLNKGVNRTAPWKAWGTGAKAEPLYVRVNRTDNPDIVDSEGNPLVEGIPTSVDLVLVLATTNGSILPANMAIFKVDDDTDLFKPFDVDSDILEVSYVYTEYRQGPLKEEDQGKIKYPSDLDDKIIDALPYEITTEDNRFNIEGTFVRAGKYKIHTCQEVIGECFSKASKTNEEEARKVFFKGGIGEEGIQLVSEMVSECRDDFDTKFEGQFFEDGTAVSYEELSSRVARLSFKEGSLHFLFVFEDEEGRPIGVKNSAMLCQSSIAQSRDVEIKYEWGAQLQHYPNIGPEVLLATHYESLYATTDNLLHSIVTYEPYCGDHSESISSVNAYTSFNLETDKHGALWYPYNNCLTPIYHVNREDGHVSPSEYNGVVEGFTENRRRNYWERMRAFDKFTPFILYFLSRIGCAWSEVTSTAEASPPYVFLGYTKIRSDHPFGQWATDRESLRVSRHWEKRNLTVEEETLHEDDGEYTLSLTEEFENLLFDIFGDLKSGEEVETPVWVHMNDGYSSVTPTSESLSHPFGHYTLVRTGNHAFNESYLSGKLDRFGMSEIFTERDYTTTTNRNVDGSKIYSPDGTEINVEGGLALKEDTARDVRLVFEEESASGSTPSWAWYADPPEIERNNRLINGAHIKNPTRVFFSKSLEPANFTFEGQHELIYTAHTFDTEGKLATHAYITLDGGPPLYVKFSTSTWDPFVAGPEKHLVQENGGSQSEIDAATELPYSPYDPQLHEGGDYTFVLNGSSLSGEPYIVLADARGLNKYDVGDTTYGTFGGVLINSSVNIDELPYKVLTVGPHSGIGMGQEEILAAMKVYENQSAFTIGKLDLKGHYFVESIEVVATYGDNFDVPSIQAEGILYGEDSNTTLFSPSGYVSGKNANLGTRYSVTYPINTRLSSISVSFGARARKKKFNLVSLIINYREPTNASETVFIYAPKFNVSTADLGTHRPSDLEFYFERTYPDFAKSYAGGVVSLVETDFDYFATPLPSTTVKFNSRKVKDILPHFEFSDPTSTRFLMDNIDITEIEGYTEDTEAFGGTKRYISGEVKTSSKGWTMYTTDHEDDPGGSLGGPNAFKGGIPLHDKQEEIYKEASNLLGDAVSIYSNFWHPKEKEILAMYGVNLDNYNWTLELNSTVAPIDRIYRHSEYGCNSQATSDYYDGRVHTIENWQPKGAFHYQCDPTYNPTCIATVMSKCTYFFWQDYGSETYRDNNVIQRFTQTFDIPADNWKGYLSRGLIDSNYTGGIYGGIVPTSVGRTTAGLTGYKSLRRYPVDPFKPSDFQ
jgi:hypothetical protein